MIAAGPDDLSARPTDGFVKDPSAEDYATAARWALKSKRWRLALEQAAAAVTLHPGQTSYLSLLDDAIRLARAPLELLKLPDSGAFFGLCAARGRALARAERFEEAFEHVFRAACFSPTSAFVPWAVEWMKSGKGAKRITAATVALQVIQLTEAARNSNPDPGWQENLEAALEIVECARERDRSVALVVAQSRVLRILGRVEDAVRTLESIHNGQDCADVTWEIASERASVESERHDTVARVAWLRRALDCRSDDIATLLDLGQALLDDGLVDDALAAYTRAHVVDPLNQAASLGVEYARLLSRGARGTEFVVPGVPSGDEGARRLALDLASYTTRLPDPVDPLISVVRGVLARMAQAHPAAGNQVPIKVEVRSDRPLAPSARLALQLGLERLGRAAVVSVHHETSGSSFGPLWDASDPPNRAVPAPAPELIDRVATLAGEPFEWTAWCVRARALGAELALDQLNAIVATMVHVPMPPGTMDAVLWVHGFQLASALIVSGAGAVSCQARLGTLLPLLSGLDDWTAAAALLGIRALISQETNAVPQILPLVEAWLVSDRTPSRPFARVLSIVGAEFARGSVLRDAIRLRARVQRDQSEGRA